MITSTRQQHAVGSDRPPRRKAAVAAAAGFLGIAAFQAALALGAPVGRAAWGGTHVQLPMALRIASAVAVGVWALAALIVLGRAGFQLLPLPPAFLRRGTWTLVGVSVLAALVNLASPSGWERFGWGPVALVLAVLCLAVARPARRLAASGSGTTSRQTRTMPRPWRWS